MPLSVLSAHVIYFTLLILNKGKLHFLSLLARNYSMQDILEMLRERNEEVPIPLDLPDEDDLVIIQEEILIHLPDDYKQFLLLVSDVICGSIEPATVCDPQSHTYLPDIASRAWDIGIPRELIPVCEVNGNFYCIAEDGEISYWVDLEPTEDNWSSIWHWAKDVWLDS